MDDASLERMASRVVEASSAPDVDPLTELVQLVRECQDAMGSVASGVAEGRLSDESMNRLWRSLSERARSACDGLRSCKREIEAVLPRVGPGRLSDKEARHDVLSR